MKHDSPAITIPAYKPEFLEKTIKIGVDFSSSTRNINV